MRNKRAHTNTNSLFQHMCAHKGFPASGEYKRKTVLRLHDKGGCHVLQRRSGYQTI